MTDDRREPPEPTPAAVGRGQRLRSVGDRLIPPGGRGRAAARLVLQVGRRGRSILPGMRDDLVEARLAAGLPYPYRSWLAAHRADEATLAGQRSIAATRSELRSVLVVVVDDGSSDVGATRRSLQAQTWPAVQVEVVVGTLAAVAVQIRRLVEQADPTTMVTIARAGDRFEPDMCFEIADAVWRDPLRALVSWDDDVDGEDPRFHAQWSPDLLLCANHLGRSFALRAATYLAAGGLDPESGEAGWWDLLLRSDLDERTAHAVPRVLAHLVRRDPDAPTGGVQVVDAWLRRSGWPATSSSSDGLVRVEWLLDEWPTVSIVIPSRSNHAMLSRLLPTLRATDYPAIEVLIVDNSGETDAKVQWYAEHGEGLDLRVIWWDDEPFNFSAVNNVGAAATSGDVLVFLNDDTEAADPRWLRDLVGWATRPEVGVVGALLLYDDGSIQHAGVRMSHHGLADHYFARLRPGDPTMAGRTDWTRDVSAVTGACAAIRRELFDGIGGFDERLVLTGNDVELSIDARRRGLRNVLTCGAVLAHHESVSRGHTTVWDDTFRSYWRFRHWVLAGDPYFSPHLRVIGPRPDVFRPFDPTAQDLMIGHFRRSLAPLPDDDLPTLDELIARCSSAGPAEIAVGSPALAASAPIEVATVNWVFSHIADPFDPAVFLALRLADRLAGEGVRQRFVVLAEPDPLWFTAAVGTPFPRLASSEVLTIGRDATGTIPPADVIVAATWDVAAFVAAVPGQGRAVRLVVEDDASAQESGVRRALADGACHLDLPAIADSAGVGEWYAGRTGMPTWVVPPFVDPGVIHAAGRFAALDGPVTVLVDVTPGHVDDCWELARPALQRLKARLGHSVRIRTVGAWPGPADRTDDGIEHLGVPDERSVGAIYREADIGLVLRTSLHPGRRIVDLLGCGVAVVAFAPTGSSWLVRDGETALVAPESLDGIVDRLDRLIRDPELRGRLAAAGESLVAGFEIQAEAALAGAAAFLADPPSHPAS